MKKFNLILTLLVVSSCAQLHHVQIGEVISHPNYIQQPFDIKISETGINIQEAGKISKAVLNNQTGKDAEQLAGIIGLFQMGPRTGNPVYTSADYAKNILAAIYEKCPSGKVTGLASIRESRKYPVISGEIVKITGFCLTPKGGS